MKTTSHVRRNADEWRRLIDMQTGSGQSQAEFCKAHRVSLSTFQYWKKRLAPTPSNASAASHGWLELPATLGPSMGGWDIELDLGDGVRLRLSRR